MDHALREHYGHRLRVRVCGLCLRKSDILLVNHAGIGNPDFWAPPGGGLEFGTNAEDNLKREFYEETGLEIKVGDFAFACELLKPPLHAVELFFHVKEIGGNLQIGFDPEIQIIKDVRWMPYADLKSIPDASVHRILRIADTKEKLEELRGFYRI